MRVNEAESNSFIRWWIWRWISITIQSSIFFFMKIDCFTFNDSTHTHTSYTHSCIELTCIIEPRCDSKPFDGLLQIDYDVLFYASFNDFGCSIYRHIEMLLSSSSLPPPSPLESFIHIFFLLLCVCHFLSLSINLFVSVAIRIVEHHTKKAGMVKKVCQIGRPEKKIGTHCINQINKCNDRF